MNDASDLDEEIRKTRKQQRDKEAEGKRRFLSGKEILEKLGGLGGLDDIDEQEE